MELAELLQRATDDGYTRNFSCSAGTLVCMDSGQRVEAEDAWVVDSVQVDQGTDPGDDATLYLIETRGGLKGYVTVSDSFHADPQTALFIDNLERRPRGG